MCALHVHMHCYTDKLSVGRLEIRGVGITWWDPVNAYPSHLAWMTMIDDNGSMGTYYFEILTWKIVDLLFLCLSCAQDKKRKLLSVS